MMTPRPEGGYDLALAGFTVSQLLVDYQFTLLLVKPLESVPDQQDAEVVIEAPFDAVIDGAAVHCEPGDDLAGLGPALPLFMRPIESARTEADGTLVLQFANANLRVPPDPDYEAWNAHIGEQEMIVAMPGGELAIWGPK